MVQIEIPDKLREKMNDGFKKIYLSSPAYQLAKPYIGDFDIDMKVFKIKNILTGDKPQVSLYFIIKDYEKAINSEFIGKEERYQSYFNESGGSHVFPSDLLKRHVNDFVNNNEIASKCFDFAKQTLKYFSNDIGSIIISTKFAHK